MRSGFTPTATDLKGSVRAALDSAYVVEKMSRPACNGEDFAAGYVAALSAHHVWSEFTEQARSKLTGTSLSADSGTKILELLRQHVGSWVSNRDLRELSGLDDAPRKARSLRLDDGWSIEASRSGQHRLNAP